jgi:hypothetical protein
MQLSKEFSHLRFQFLANMHSDYNIKLDKEQSIQFGGGKDKEYKFIDIDGLYTFNCHIRKTKDSVDISVLSTDEKDCAIIYIDKGTRTAMLSSMSYDKYCAKEGLKRPGGGEILLRFVLNLILWNKEQYNLKRILLKDNSYIACNNCPENMKLSRLRIVLKGSPWYMKYGFKPFDKIKNKPADDLIKELHINKSILDKLKTQDVDIMGIINKSGVANINTNEIKRLIGKYVLLRDFIGRISRTEEYCCVVEYVLQELFVPKRSKGFTLYDFYEKSFYLDI